MKSYFWGFRDVGGCCSPAGAVELQHRMFCGYQLMSLKCIQAGLVVTQWTGLLFFLQVITPEMRPLSQGLCCWLPWHSGSLRVQLHSTGRSVVMVTPAASVATTFIVAQMSQWENVTSMSRESRRKCFCFFIKGIWMLMKSCCEQTI